MGTALGQTAELGSYNVIESRSSVSSGGLFNTFFVGTATHEFLHTLDARDLYRGGNAMGNPVGIWDVMAASDAMSWPLAITREDIGWYTIPDKENEGTYTLCAPGDVDASVGKENAIAIRSPLSDSEYFVVEYRQQGQTISALDRNIGGSGLVVYRVNPAYAAEGNIKGNDYVYVFRQNETGISDSAGDVLAAQVGTSAYGAPRQTIGSLAMEDGITTGALCYSNGRNSGLKIDVTEQTNGSITFNVTHADYTSMDLWRDAKDASGAALPTGENVSDTQVVAGEDALYCLTESSGDVPLLHVWKYADGVWADCGQVASGLSRARMEWHAGSLYVAASDYRSNRVVLKKFENGAWQEKAHIGKAANDVRMSSVNGVLYVLADDMSSAHAQVYAYGDGTLRPLGGELPVGYMAHPALFEVGGAPVVACGDFGSDFRGKELKVFRYQGNAWATTATLTDGCPVALDGVDGHDGAYVFYSYQGVGASAPRLLKINDDGTIAATQELSALPQNMLRASISADDTRLYLGIVGQDNVAEMYSVAYAEIGEAKALGQAVYSPASTIDSAVLNGTVYCGVSGNVPGGAYVKMHAALGSADARITISYVSSDAAMGTVNRASEQVAASTGAAFGATANAAPGYHFVNWTDASGAVVSRSAVFKPSKNPQTQAYAAETYKANFAANAYKISFNANGGTGIMSAQSMTYGRAAALSPNRFVRNGYAFLGWSRSISAVAAQYKDGQIVTNLTSGDGATVALYAVWKKVEKPSVSYSTHVQTYGWQGTAFDGATSGTVGRAKRLEGLKVSLNAGAGSGSIQYRTHVQTYGWESGWKADGAVSGTVGQAKRLEAVQIRLSGDVASRYDVYYRVHAQGFGWMGWAKNGESAGTAGYAYRLEAMQVQLVPKGSGAPGPTDGAFRSAQVSYSTHVQTYGWQGTAFDGATSGTVGRAKRLEGLKVSLNAGAGSGSIQYRTHVQTYGWESGWKADGAVSGTVGQAKRLEAVQIRLSGDVASRYDVYYRVHAQGFGWMGWAKNGESAGTAGYAYRLEAMQVQLVPKGSGAPGPTDGAFRSR